MTSVPLGLTQLDTDLPKPAYHTDGACGFDLASRVTLSLEPGQVEWIQTGCVFRVPPGFVLLICGRSSLVKKRLVVANGVGVIDRDFCGPKDEVCVAIKNDGATSYTIQKGERLAQGLLIPCATAQFVEILGGVSENRGGFGTTG